MRAIIAGLVAEGFATVTDGCGRAWKIRRVRSIDLADHGLAELAGAASADQAVVDLREEYRLATGADPERLAAIKARETEALEAAAKRRIERDPLALSRVQDRIDQVVCAGVVGCGEADGPPGAVATVETEPVALVFDRAEEDHEAGRVWVGHVAEEVRQGLFASIEELIGATKIRPFRGAAGAAAAPAPGGKGVRDRSRKRA